MATIEEKDEHDEEDEHPPRASVTFLAIIGSRSAVVPLTGSSCLEGGPPPCEQANLLAPENPPLNMAPEQHF
jgi:hypothetical protein